MIAKTIEIRDAATFIPALAVRLDPDNPQDRYLFARAGYGLTASDQAQYIFLARISGGNGEATSDPYDWSSRTMQVAHNWLIDHFDEILSGAVVDVEFILGTTTAPKVSESVEYGGT